MMPGPVLSAKPPLCLHFMYSFASGGAQVRTACLMNHFGKRYRHCIVTVDGDFSAAGKVDRAVEVEYVSLASARKRRTGPHWLQAIGRTVAQRQPDLVLTYNWAGVDGLLAARWWWRAPILHAEDGFSDQEARQQKARRLWIRRIALCFASKVIAPSQTLVSIMHQQWKLRESRIEYIPNGVDIKFFAPAARPQLDSRNADVVVGTVGGLRLEKHQERLVEACARVATSLPLRLVIAGDGLERSRLEGVSRVLGFSQRTKFLGYLEDPRPAYNSFDIFALTSSTEQMPLSVLEAMACELPVVSLNVGDIRNMVAQDNQPFVVETLDQFSSALATLARDPALRRRLGVANQRRCAEVYSKELMFERYSRLYDEGLRTRATRREV